MQAHQYFFASKIRLSNPGELGPLIDNFARELSTMGYSTRSIDKHVQSVAHLGEWAQIKNIVVNDFGSDH